jgi:hypothetical protein
MTRVCVPAGQRPSSPSGERTQGIARTAPRGLPSRHANVSNTHTPTCHTHTPRAIRTHGWQLRVELLEALAGQPPRCQPVLISGKAKGERHPINVVT